MSKSYLVTGGTGFIGSSLVRRLIIDGHSVRVLDSNLRGNPRRLHDVLADIDLVEADIRDPVAVERACRGMDSVVHLAYINGTEFFYTKPELVLDVAVNGMMNVLNGCRQAGLPELILASSSEVYQTPPVIPTDEAVALSVPDPLNPRYSYGGGKIISELLAINYGRSYLERVIIFRPHNVYGPDMGWEHVIPQFLMRMKELCKKPEDPVRFPVQGTGKESRSFVFVDDFTDGVIKVLERGEHLGIYNIGTMEEITVERLAQLVADYYGRRVEIVPGNLTEGSTKRRCPDIAKLSLLGYQPRYSLREGLAITAEWYHRNTKDIQRSIDNQGAGAMTSRTKSVAGTNSSVVVENCQICGNAELEQILFLGYLPPVNKMNPIGEKAHEQASYPAQLLYCPRCHLVQLGLIVDPQVLFPSEYPYTSSTTKILRENFAELYQDCKTVLELGTDDLVIDIGSNDGNLLSNFKDHHRVLGITPEKIGEIAIERGIPTIIDYFTPKVVETVLAKHGHAKIITATNVFAHIENVNAVVELIIQMMAPKGLFISESHYLLSLIQTLQYDTIYHEHLRYYSLHSLKFLLESHGLEIVHAKPIPTHGGSIRVYAARRGDFPVLNSVSQLLETEKSVVLGKEALMEFKDRVILSKLELQALLLGIKQKRQRIYGISAPSRGSTLVNYAGLDDGILDCVVEIKGSHKIGKYLPGTLIPVIDETRLYEDQPEYALLLSWHIADELIPKLKQKGFQGSFIVPLPKPRVVK